MIVIGPVPGQGLLICLVLIYQRLMTVRYWASLANG